VIFIKKALKKKEATESLVAFLDKRVSGFEPARSFKKIHMSDISKDGYCPREVALLDVTNKSRKGQYISTALQVAFDNGNALHDLCRNKWLEFDVVGSWLCPMCRNTLLFSKKPKVKCNTCHAKLWEYQEETFIDPLTKAQGSIDFFIDFGTGKHVMCEVKSISKDDFKELKAPLAEHRVRTNLYLELLHRSENPHISHINLSSAKVLYISKGYGAKTDFGKVIPFREFNVEYDFKSAQPYFEKAAKVELFRASGIMPVGICPNSMVNRVKTCSVPQACWSGSYPAGA